jgi:hypothetical protein
MANKRTQRVSGARHTVHEMNAGDFDWWQLEQAYGHEFSTNARKRIVEVTNYFFIHAGMEIHAEPVNVAIKVIRDLDILVVGAHSVLRRARQQPEKLAHSASRSATVQGRRGRAGQQDGADRLGIAGQGWDLPGAPTCGSLTRGSAMGG